jgi:hypothetical protein
MPKPKTRSEHLVDYTLERLEKSLQENDGQTGQQLSEAQITDVAIALQRLIGATGGEAAELRLLAILMGAGIDCGKTPYLFGDAARAIAEARLCAAADAAAAAGATA